MTGKNIYWMAAALLLSTAGTTFAGPGLGPYGPWNRGGGGGGFSGFPPPYRVDRIDRVERVNVVGACPVGERFSTRYATNYFDRAPTRIVSRRIVRPAPVAERLVTVRTLAPVAEETTGCVTSVTRGWTADRPRFHTVRRVATTVRETDGLEAVGERIITTRPARRVFLSDRPAWSPWNAPGPYFFQNMGNPYR